jgi:hydroperoxide dehydratase
MTSKTASSSVADEADTKLSPSGFPVKEVPGGYGVPFFSPLKDRLDYYYLQGAEEYFRSRIARNGGATVLRVNMPPGPFITCDSGVVALLDARSFAVLLDDAKVDKTDTLDGTFMPSLKLFGGYRPLAFLDAADPRHAAIKGVVIRLAVARMHQVAPTFNASFGAMFDAVDAGIDSGPVQFNKLNQHHMFDFTCCALFGGTPPSKAMGDGAVTKAVKWLLLQLHPIASKVIKPWPLEDLLPKGRLRKGSKLATLKILSDPSGPDLGPRLSDFKQNCKAPLPLKKLGLTPAAQSDKIPDEMISPRFPLPTGRNSRQRTLTTCVSSW